MQRQLSMARSTQKASSAVAVGPLGRNDSGGKAGSVGTGVGGGFNASLGDDSGQPGEAVDCSGYNMSALQSLEDSMADFHGYLSSSICIAGVLLNIIVCVVLTRKAMRNPFNLILTCIGLCDIMKLTSYTYYAIYLYVLSEPMPQGGHSWLGILLILVHNFVSIVGHVIGTLFTVALAFFRFVAVYFPTEGPAWCSMRRAKCCLACIVAVSLVATAPNSFIYKVTNHGVNGTDSWWFAEHAWVRELHVETLNMYIYGIFVKMTSSLLNCIFSGMLLYTLRQVRKRRKRLKADRVRSREARSLRENTRTTVLLVAVVASFTVTEFPQGCLNLAAAVNQCVFNTIYRQVGNVMDLLVLLNSATNFFWLYGMSSQFRGVFVQVFVPKFLVRARQDKKQQPEQQQQQRQSTCVGAAASAVNDNLLQGGRNSRAGSVQLESGCHNNTAV